MATGKECLQPFVANPDEPVNYFDKQITPTELLSSILGNQREKGWWFAAGDPEFWKFAGRLIIPGGKALDLGMGHDGRTSLPFALQGMAVTGYETDPNALVIMRAIKKSYDLPIDIKAEDINTADFGTKLYDTVLLGQTFIHFPSKAEALTVLAKAITAIKPGGHLWLRAGGIYDESFEDLHKFQYLYPDEVWQLNEDVFIAPCSCSGEVRLEPQLFLDPIELLVNIANQGMRFVHTQIIPQRDHANIMYGEDFRKGSTPNMVRGLITALAQRL